MMTMRVLWFTNVPTGEAACVLGEKNLRIGGWIESLKNELACRAGVTLGVAFSWTGGDYRVFDSGNVRYFKLPFIKPARGIRGRIASLTHQLESLQVVEYCLRAVEDFQPDIIQIFGTEKNYGLIIREVEVPCIIHVQGVLNEIYKRYFTGITRMDILRYGDRRKLLKGGGLLHGYYLMKKQAQRELQIFSACKFFMGRTDWDQEIVRRYAPQAVYYHCDEMLRPEFYSCKWEMTERQKRVVYSTIGNVCYKGLEALIEAGFWLKENTNTSFEFRLGGIASTDEVFRIVRSKYGGAINEFVRPLGIISVEGVVEQLKGADVFVHPSHIDNSPNSVCEAMLMGVPVVSTNVGGMPSIIEEGKEGLLVRDGDVIATSRAIDRLFHDSNYSLEVSHNARKRALERHARDRILVRVMEIYDQLSSAN